MNRKNHAAEVLGGPDRQTSLEIEEFMALFAVGVFSILVAGIYLATAIDTFHG